MRRRYVNRLVLASVVALAASGAALATLLPPSSGAQKPDATFGAAPAISGGLVVGLSEGAAGWGGKSTAPRLNGIMSTTNARWLRDAFLWSRIEPSRGKFRFSYYDHYLLLAARRGLHLVAQLVGTPKWAGAAPDTIPSDATAYAHYVAAVVGRYGPGGTFWRGHPKLSGSAISIFELWNEPYFDNGNNGDYNPGRYARLVKAASIAGHAVNPSAKFLLEAEMESHLGGVWVWWVDALYHAVPDLNNYFDGIAVHDFGHYTKTLNPIVPGKPYGNFGHIRRIEDIRRQFVRHGGAGKPFWILETGWSTCTQRSIDCVTQAQQAANLATLFGYLDTTWKNWVQAAFIYRYKDGARPTTVQDGYGLVHLNGRPKPALRLFKTFAAASAI
jgi:hypothetical protein